MKLVAMVLLLSAVAFGQHSVTLTYNPLPAGTSGGSIYRAATATGALVKQNTNLITTNTFLDSNVLGCTSYWYAATATGTNGVESVFTNRIIALIPANSGQTCPPVNFKRVVN